MQEKRGIPSWVAIGFGVVAVALVVALIIRSKQAADEKQKDEQTITYHSNNWVKASAEEISLIRTERSRSNQYR